MTRFSGIEQHPEQRSDQRQTLSVRLPGLVYLMLGQAPLRRLAQSLITLLLLLSPVSFTTDAITNFVYECPVSLGSSLQDRRSAVARRTVAFPSAALSAASGALDVRTTPTVFRTSQAEQISIPFPSRASPV